VAQPRFQSWGSNFLVYGITTLLQKKLDRSSQFDAVGYIITLYSSKSYVKSWGSIQILGRSGPPINPHWLRPWLPIPASDVYCHVLSGSIELWMQGVQLFLQSLVDFSWIFENIVFVIIPCTIITPTTCFSCCVLDGNISAAFHLNRSVNFEFFQQNLSVPLQTDWTSL